MQAEQISDKAPRTNLGSPRKLTNLQFCSPPQAKRAHADRPGSLAAAWPTPSFCLGKETRRPLRNDTHLPRFSTCQAQDRRLQGQQLLLPVRLETAFNRCTISSRAISSFLSQNLILRLRAGWSCSPAFLRTRGALGWGSRGEGARQRSLPRIGPRAPPRGRALRGVGVGAAWRKRKLHAPGASLRPPGSPASAPPAVTWEPRVRVTGPCAHPCGDQGAGRVHLRGHLAAGQIPPRGPRLAALPSPWPRGTGAARPSSPVLRPPSWERKGEPGERVGARRPYLQPPRGRCRGCSSRARPARAAACRRAAPGRGSVGPQVAAVHQPLPPAAPPSRGRQAQE